MSNVKMYVSVSFPGHEEERENGEKVFIQPTRHVFSYKWKSKYNREKSKENRKIIIDIMKEDKKDDIKGKIKQIISLYQMSTGATITKHVVAYGVDFNA